MIDLRPTGTCFTDALEFLEALARQVSPPTLQRYRLLHGLCEHRASGAVHAHAWVEVDEWAIFAAMDDSGVKAYYKADRRAYFHAANVIECRGYTVAEAWHENFVHGTYGPWVPRYLERCANFIGPARPVSTSGTSAASCRASAGRPGVGSRPQFDA